MSEFTWENLVAFTVWKCKLCGDISDKDGIANHLHNKHGIKSIDFFESSAYSHDYLYPNVIKKDGS